MNGYEATKTIRTEMNDTIKTIPIIAMKASFFIADKKMFAVRHERFYSKTLRGQMSCLKRFYCNLKFQSF